MNGKYKYGDEHPSGDGRRFLSYSYEDAATVERWLTPIQWEARLQKNRVDYWDNPPPDTPQPSHAMWAPVRGATRPNPGVIPLGYKVDGWLFNGWLWDRTRMAWMPQWILPSVRAAHLVARGRRPANFRLVNPGATVTTFEIPGWDVVEQVEDTEGKIGVIYKPRMAAEDKIRRLEAKWGGKPRAKAVSEMLGFDVRFSGMDRDEVEALGPVPALSKRVQKRQRQLTGQENVFVDRKDRRKK